jgi:hypothetical protein
MIVPAGAAAAADPIQKPMRQKKCTAPPRRPAGKARPSERRNFFGALCRAGQGPQTTSASQLPVVSRGGIWDIIQISIAARIATAAPMITCTVIAVVPWKPKTQGETSVHNPTIETEYPGRKEQKRAED